MATTHLVVFYAVTAGVNGPLLGSDEEDIVLMQFLIWDVRHRKVLTEQQYLVQPGGSDVNENLLSEQCREEYSLTEELLNQEGRSLDTIIDSFDAIITKLRLEGGTPTLITDGQLHLRQVLHPKALSKGVQLPDFYDTFFDIRKEFKSFFHTSIDVQSCKDMIQHLDLEVKQESLSSMAVNSIRDLVLIVDKMVAEGHRFALPEKIFTRLEPGICTKGEEVDNNCVVRARGLPWQSSDQDIAKFFRGLNIAKGGVALCLSLQGRRNGEALVRFVSAEHRDMALKRHKHHIGNRYIEVYKATGEDFINVAGGNNNEAQQFLSRGGQVIIRMRGLPYDCTAKQVVEFFESGEKGCDILDGEEGVLFVRKPDGRATGDAFVLFSNEDDSGKALAKHREIIGSRYIELFRSTTAEVQQVLNRTMDPRTHEPQQPLMPHLPTQLPVMSQQLITSGTRKDCIRLRGLPYEAQVEHVLEFLGEHAKCIVFRGVHMVINSQGQPSGEAFIQMDSEHSAFLAAQNRHHRYMIFGKKQRYIEVFQCSGEDMNLVLSGGVTAQRAPVLSHGMLLWDPNNPAAVGTVPQGAATTPPITPGFLAPPPSTITRPPFSGVMIPPFPHSFPPPGNGALVPAGMVPATQIKPPETVLVKNLPPPQLRPPFVPPHGFVPTAPGLAVSQSQASTLLQAATTPKPTSLATPMPMANSVLYPSLASSNAGTSTDGVNAASPSMVLLSGAKVPAGNSYHATFPPGISYVPFSSTPDIRKSQPYQPKYTISSPLVQLSYSNAPLGLTAARLPLTVPLAAKRSFDQAFAGDKSPNPQMQIKRAPTSVRVSAPQMAAAASAPTYANSHLAAPQILSSHQFASQGAPPPTIGPAAMQMLPSLYPPAQLYPPTI